ncbi:S26 family signal peptidase [Inquilinus limosus]|uniref:S26 family signal peptidase n=1 Tax=Inquilinus limosus TaxID=171674 RepID=UPI003F1440B4
MLDGARRRTVLGAAAGAVLATGFAVVIDPAPRLTFNASASAPIGFHVLEPEKPLRIGDFVLVRLPGEAAALAAERGYLPSSVPAVKQVAALAGDRICGRGRQVLVNGRMAAERLAADGLGRGLPSWEGCRTVRPGEVFLLTQGVRASFDGRYFGPVDAGAVLGRLVPLWTW